MPFLACWTCSDLETQPRVRRDPDAPGRARLTLVVGVREAPAPFTTEPPLTEAVDVVVEHADGDRWTRCPAGYTVTELTLDELERRGRTHPGPEAGRAWVEAQCHLQDVRRQLAGQTRRTDRGRPARFVEVVLAGSLPYGALARVVVRVGPGQQDAVTARAALWLVAPEFAGEHLLASAAADGQGGWLADEDHWALLHRVEDDLEHIRLDLLRTDDGHQLTPGTGLAPLTIGLRATDGTRTEVTTTGAPPYPDGDTVPAGWTGMVVDRSTDSVLLTRPRDPALAAVTVTTRTGRVTEVAVTPTTPPGQRPVAVLIIQYCIQGLNDLFPVPSEAYDPPRSYIEVTYSDEDAAYASKPQTRETEVPDGYRFSILAEAAYGTRTHWVLNAGSLLLLRHGLPPERFAELAARVADGTLSVQNAGYGAHRPKYYGHETNRRELREGTALLDRLLPPPPGAPPRARLYYPDQRLYGAQPCEVEVFRDLGQAGELHYLVLDRVTLAHRSDGTDAEQLYFGDGTSTGDAGNHIWVDEPTGVRLLLIEQQFKDELLNPGEDELRRGQLGYWLRRRLLRAVAHPVDGPSRIYVYADDAEHSAANGWFDGGVDSPLYTQAYLAALHWFAAHPWVDVTTLDDPGFDPDRYTHPEPVRRLRVSSAIDGTLDRCGATTRDAFGKLLHFDTWYDWWCEHRSSWLGQTLGEVSGTLEAALSAAAADPAPAVPLDADLVDLAWLHFLLGTHESFWSQQPWDGDMNTDPRRWDPEDFVVSETLQLRASWVHLNAAVWAGLRGGLEPGRTHAVGPGPGADVDPGPLLPALRRAGWADPPWPGAPEEARGRYLDRDNLATPVLYDDAVLVVLDQNGGRVTHLYCRVGDRVVSVSGNAKAHQFLTLAPPRELAGDGPRMDNTPFSPNHAYLASDVRQAGPSLVTVHDQRRSEEDNPDLGWMPDLFNRYRCTVRTAADGSPELVCRYEHTGPAVDGLRSWADVEGLLARDRDAVRAGGDGVVEHPDPPFEKVLRLAGTTLHVSYRGVQPGHVVANELSPDLLGLLRGAPGARLRLSPDRREAALTTAEGWEVAVCLGANCAFETGVATAASLTGSSPAARRRRREHARLHRVLSDDLRIVCARGGDFDYRVELPHG